MACVVGFSIDGDNSGKKATNFTTINDDDEEDNNNDENDVFPRETTSPTG